MGSHDAAVCGDSWSKSIYPSPGRNLQHCKWLKPQHNNRASFMVGLIQEAEALSPTLTAHRPSYLSKIFQTWIRQSKVLYSTALLSSTCTPWSNGASWPDFASSTVLSWHKGQFHTVSSQSGCWHIFPLRLVKLWSDVGSSQPSVTQAGDSDEIVHGIGKTGSI